MEFALMLEPSSGVTVNHERLRVQPWNVVRLPCDVILPGRLDWGVVSATSAGDTDAVLRSVNCKVFISRSDFRVVLVTPRAPNSGQLTDLLGKEWLRAPSSPSWSTLLLRVGLGRLTWRLFASKWPFCHGASFLGLPSVPLRLSFFFF